MWLGRGEECEQSWPYVIVLCKPHLEMCKLKSVFVRYKLLLYNKIALIVLRLRFHKRKRKHKNIIS